VDSGQSKILEKSLETARFPPNPTAKYQGYLPDIKAFCTPDIIHAQQTPLTQVQLGISVPWHWSFSEV